MISTVLNSLVSFFTSLTLKDIIGAVWAPFSIFVGAWTAFYFNNRRAARERTDEEVTEGNLAISVLAQFHNQLLQYRINYIDPHRNAPDAWFKIMAGPPLDSIQIELNRNNLGFLLQSNGAVWQQAVLEERRFYLVKALIDERNDMLAKAWAKLEEAGIKHGSAILMSDVERILGPVLYQQLQQMGTALVEQVTQNVTSSMEAIAALRAELIRAFPKRKFISVVAAATSKEAAPVAKPSTTLADLFTPLLSADLSPAVRAPLRSWLNDEIDDGLAYGRQARLRRWTVDSFFSAPLVRDGDAGGMRKRSWS